MILLNERAIADKYEVKQSQADLCSKCSLHEVYESASLIIQMYVQEFYLILAFGFSAW